VKLPIAWLRDYLDVALCADELAERLAALGFPVDEIVRRPALSGVRVGRLVRVEKHPNADRLLVCTVDVAGPGTLTIATAATNVAEGDVVPVATLGAQLVGVTIGPRKMRGIDSEGMLCSAAELGLEAEWFEDGILQLETDLEIGADFIELFHLCDDVLEVEVTANRVDAMSIVGLARELGAAIGGEVRTPETHLAPAADMPTGNVVRLESPDCKRFVAQRVSNVQVRRAPFWMRVRLALAGQRPINNLVDISNFVMLETAQPLHFYDAARLAGERLVVRDARDGEPIRTLDDAERKLDPRFLVIADEREPQCIAGLMGAAPSEVTEATRDVLIEAATFSGPRVRRMSVALGLRTEASTRHEKGLPLGLSTWGAARAAYLLQREGATISTPFEAGEPEGKPAMIPVPLARFAALLGMPVGADAAVRALVALGFSARTGPGGTIEATPPFWRSDVRIVEDVIEEVARIVGYDRIEATVPAIAESRVPSDEYRTESRIAHAFAAAGYREAVTFALQPGSVARRFAQAGIALPGAVIEIRNPLSEDQRYLRFSLLPGLLELAARYARDDPYRSFEIGHVFEGEPEPFETPGTAWLLALPKADEPSWRDSGFLTFKGESLAVLRALTGRAADTVSATGPGWHPGKTAALLVEGKDVARIGAVDPRLLAAFGIESSVYAGWMHSADLTAYRAPRYKPASKYPVVSRDLALIVAPEVPALDIEHAVRAGADGAIADVRVFDEYRGPQIEAGKKSIAVRVVLQRADATLTDAEADTHVAAILAALRERCGARIRD
jgi:phenylalanyl-tRNA synthetase beta chain